MTDEGDHGAITFMHAIYIIDGEHLAVVAVAIGAFDNASSSGAFSTASSITTVPSTIPARHQFSIFGATR